MANKVYQHDETAITWRASGGTNLLTLTSLSNGAGHQGALDDLTTSARSRRYAWRFYMKFGTNPVVNEVIEIYAKTSDGSHPDNDDGTGDIAVSAEDKLRNLKLIGVLIVDEASSTPEFVASGYVELPHRYFGPVIWNRTTKSFSATAADHGFDLTPVPDEIQ